MLPHTFFARPVANEKNQIKREWVKVEARRKEMVVLESIFSVSDPFTLKTQPIIVIHQPWEEL